MEFLLTALSKNQTYRILYESCRSYNKVGAKSLRNGDGRGTLSTTAQMF